MRRGKKKVKRANGVDLTNKTLWQRMVDYKYIYFMLIPGIAFFLLFNYAPLYGVQLAFKDFKISQGIWHSPFVGLEKFKMIFSNEQFWSAFKNTVSISFLKLAFGFPVPIILAILINEVSGKKYKRSLQTVLTFPHFMSWVVVSGLVINLLGNTGIVNNIIYALGKERVGFMVEPNVFRGLLVVSDVWKESGWSSIMYLAAIASISPFQYESATIDGANRFQKMLYITWPGIRNLAAILLILAAGNMMNANFDQVFNLYNPAVYSKADIIDTYIFRITFLTKPDYGFSTAVGLFKGFVNFALLITANTAAKKFGASTIL